MLSYVCYIKYTINPTGQSDEKHNDKEDENNYLIDRVLEKFFRALSICFIRNKEAFFLNYAIAMKFNQCLLIQLL